MAGTPPRPGGPKSDARRAPLPELPARSTIDAARARARIAGDATASDDGAAGGPTRSMPVLRWKERAGR
jgi:hypothetical protein